MYRSKQRGFLELDLVLGTWAEQHVRSMDEANVRSLLQILDLESYPALPLPLPLPLLLTDLATHLIVFLSYYGIYNILQTKKFS
uniref:Uncharacterized protein n=3 Tax=Aegilops tauschii subsp. strangulata TaxID=200361 RepID=A0A453TCK9_AEGTS